MTLREDNPYEFDFFVDEDTRSQRIGVLCIEKQLTPALTQALFRVRENNRSEYRKRVFEDTTKTEEEQVEKAKQYENQIREIKWSKLNFIRSFVAQGFLEQFFHYAARGPLPIIFFNAPFTEDHINSMKHFFDQIPKLKLEIFRNAQFSKSVLFLDSFTTPQQLKLEEKIRQQNNISRCYRIDSRAHDLIQLTDILLGITVARQEKKKISSNEAKLHAYKKFEYCEKNFLPKYRRKHESTYYLNTQTTPN